MRLIPHTYDLETYPNCFLFGAINEDTNELVQFEVSQFVNEAPQLMNWLRTKASTIEMVGFNNVGFDYPILHEFILSGGLMTPLQISHKAQQIIADNYIDERKFAHIVRQSDRFIPQIDLYKICHFDNKARLTSLKALQFAMRMDNIRELPFPVGMNLNQEQIQVLRSYHKHDLKSTMQFHGRVKDKVEFRRSLIEKIDGDVMNYNDTKIGKQFFVQELERAKISCYNYGEFGRKPRQTPRQFIKLDDAILPWIKFERPEFQNVVNELHTKIITETKGALKMEAVVNGFTYCFALGGIHGSVESTIVQSDDEFMILDLDVSSYYPNLAITQKLFPAHLGAKFCDVYKTLYDSRGAYAKGTPENAMLKLALNGVYGDSNNKFSPFYDPLFTMSITLNGQLLLCMLAEQLIKIDRLSVIQINTDGITIRMPRCSEPQVRSVCDWWMKGTGMKLEDVEYTKMAIRDVNNYIAVKKDGKVKLKGEFEYNHESDGNWHKNWSALIIPKVVEQVIVYGKDAERLIRTWPDPYDFFLRAKVPQSSRLMLDTYDGEIEQQRITRYYASLGGGELIKIMPPLKGKSDLRRIAICKGQAVTPCNGVEEAKNRIDYRYYINEVQKLVESFNGG